MHCPETQLNISAICWNAGILTGFEIKFCGSEQSLAAQFKFVMFGRLLTMCRKSMWKLEAFWQETTFKLWDKFKKKD